MKNSFKIILSVLTLAFVLGGCGKYEQGPAFSLLTKKARITGLWVAESLTTPSGDVTFYDEKHTLKINKDDSFLRQNLVTDELEEGTWTFTSEKESIILTYKKSGNPYVEELEIVKLKNNEFWVRNSGGDQINYKSDGSN
ncbi:hypothetical protein [Brumimicrobium mesophilum]|uniref:hypothetical protein n=1 Tax=Brumimicrobium mesophilum TaxID=392717 RepID=UPI000D13F7F3|nr:hypothetical protein [Brumimicrobium mesophilum]